MAMSSNHTNKCFVAMDEEINTLQENHIDGLLPLLKWMRSLINN